MSYSSTDQNQTLDGSGSFAVNNVGGITVINQNGPIEGRAIGNIPGVNFGDTSGPNSVNPSGTPNGVTLPTQNNFR